MSKRFLGKYDGKKQGWLRSGVLLVLLIAVALILVQFVVGVSRVSGHSMDPTLNDGELVFYLRTTKEYQRGDIVAISMPSGEKYVKRVVALPGDTVELQDGKLLVNGEEAYFPAAHGETQPQTESVKYPLEVGADRVFVLGDNREDSIDSRTFGAVPFRQVSGRMIIQK